MNPERVGHTGITWPSTPEGVAQAIADVASLGYRGFETFGFLIDQYPNGIEGLRAELERHELPLISAYCSAPLIDPATAGDDVQRMVAWARKLKALGGSVLVIGAGRRTKASYTADEYRSMVQTLNEIGRRLRDVGIAAAFHPHTGTPVETRLEIDAVMGEVEPEVVFFAPDTGQIQKGGSDPIEVLRAYRPLIRHLHLKDYAGRTRDQDQRDTIGNEIDRTGYLNYVPLGMGMVDIPGIVQLLDAGNYQGWWMVELDGTPAAPRPPREAARISKLYLESLIAGQTHG